jgi:hypothetical protein
MCEVSVKVMLVALTPPNVTAVVTPAPETKFVPWMVTAWPPATGPLPGLTLVTVGVAAYV